MTTVYVTPDHDTTMVNSPTEETYNGWSNYETWNVSLWIGNDEGLYNDAKMIARRAGRYPYQEWCAYMESVGMQSTPDGVRWMDGRIDEDEMNEMMEELVEH